jgi:5-(carboxyamino)imidazole ribonucleotide mutase
MSADTPWVGVTMGSESDLPVMTAAAEILTELGIPHEVRITSAHRTPHEMIAYGVEAADRGLRVLIAGAGGAAHLPGMLAAVTHLPVIGVPVRTGALNGMDSLLSIVQMPRGVPVATVAIDNARNAGLLAARILAIAEPELRARLVAWQAAMSDAARASDRPVPGTQRTNRDPLVDGPRDDEFARTLDEIVGERRADVPGAHRPGGDGDES